MKLKKLRLAIILTTSLCLFALIFGQLFVVRQIYCTSQFGPCPQEFVSHLNTLSGTSIFMASTTSLSFPKEVVSSKLTRKLPHKLEIMLTLKSKAGLIRAGSKYYQTYSDGSIGDEVQSSSQPILILELDSPPQSLSKEILDSLIILGKPIWITEPIVSANYDSNSLTIHLKSNTKIILSPKVSPELSLPALQSILAQSKIQGKLPTIVDLRYNNPIVTYN